MTVAELSVRLTSVELTEWMALWAIRGEEAERAKDRMRVSR